MGVAVGDLNYLPKEEKCLLRSGKDWGGLGVGLGVVGSNLIGGRAEFRRQASRWSQSAGRMTFPAILEVSNWIRW